MQKTLFAGAAFMAALLISSTSYAFQCPGEIKKAEAAIAEATTAMEAMSDKKSAGLVHTLIDDAKALLSSGRHHHEKPAAGGYDHARALAKINSAVAYADAAETLAKR